jgi:hypothetical protein
MNHLSKFILFASAWSLFSVLASAKITLVNPTIATTGASNVVVSPTGETATFYYSNVSSTVGTNPSGEAVYIGTGGPCSSALNPNCRVPSDIFTLNVKSTAPATANAEFYLLTCATPPVLGTAITTSCTILDEVPYTNGSSISPLAAVWGNICTAVNEQGVVTDLNPGTCVSATNSVNGASLYLMADPRGSGVITSEIMNFILYFDSVIPVNSSSKGTVSGLYDFHTYSGGGVVGISYISVDSLFPTEENGGVGIQYARFYYYADTASGSSAFDAKNFSNIPALPQATLTPYSQMSISNSGGALQTGTIYPVTNGVRYYFEAALVDYAGNVGYQSVDNPGITHTVVPSNTPSKNVGRNGL